MSKYRFETLSIHAGYTPDATRARALPLYRTTAYTFNDAEHAAQLFALETPGHIYSRMSNPTQDMLEERVAALEGVLEQGGGALALASGTSAIFYCIINLACQGDEIVSVNNLYGGTYTMFDAILPQFGITTRFVRPNDLAGMQAAINERTRAIYVETIGNPTLEMADLEAISVLAKRHNLPLVVDGTFTSPYLLRAAEYGADIIVHSLTKWMGGHGTAIGGIVVDANSFDWKDPKFSLYNEPDSSYHGVRWGHDIQGLPPFLTRMRTVPLRNLGASLAPDNIWMFLQGLETLGLRMDRHCSNALAVARYLQAHPQVDWVRYPLLEGDAAYSLAQKYKLQGGGGMVVFGIKGTTGGGGKEAGQRFIDSLGLFSHLANVGDAKSLALHPASTTHSQLSNQQQEEAGLLPEMIRLSIGLEHIDDIIGDLEQALAKSVA